MPYEIMKDLDLKVDNTQGRCCAMDKREVAIIATINALPYRLSTYPEKELTMSVLVVDIPPQYGMLLSRKWSATMGGSLQCDLSHAMFQIDNKVVKINREPKCFYMIVEDENDNMACFVDTYVDSFRAECVPLRKNDVKPQMAVEVEIQNDRGDLWTYAL